MSRQNKHIVLEGMARLLLSPLSHIGESTGPESFLNTIKIIGADWKPTEIFLYSGNAFRGMLRDKAADYMMRGLGITSMPLDTFYLFFSGGAIGGEQSIDIDQARRLRKALPMFSIFGGGVGNQLVEGKMNVGALYPICRETSHLLSDAIGGNPIPWAAKNSWREFLTEQNYTRTDDAKNEGLREKYLEAAETPLLPGEESGTGNDKKKSDRKPQQMRYGMELLAPGTPLYQRIDLIDMNDLELGAFVSGLCEFQEHPYLGGANGKGHGLCEISYFWREANGTEWKPFMSIGANHRRLEPEAAQAKQSYDAFLKRIYDDYLSGNRATLAQLVSGEVAS